MRRIVRREADLHTIPGNHPDAETPHSTGELGGDAPPVVERNLIAATAEDLLDGAFSLDEVVSCHAEADTSRLPRHDPASGPSGCYRSGVFRPPVTALALLLALTLGGTVGFHQLTDLNWADALYMTVITLSTVGFGEVQPLDGTARLFTIGLIVLGVGTAFYTVVAVAEFVIEGRLGGALGRRRMKRRIEAMRDHVILCGYGRLGRAVASDLASGGVEMVILENDPERVPELEASGFAYQLGSALDDGALREVGIEHARALVAAMHSDADNVFLTLSAREANSECRIHATAHSEAGAHRIRLAGAHQVISPYSMGGQRIAGAIVRPAVVDFIELSHPTGSSEFNLEEIVIGSGCAICDQPIRALEDRGIAVSVIAIQHGTEPIRIRPGGDDMIRDGDHVVAVGDSENLGRLAELAATRANA